MHTTKKRLEIAKDVLSFISQIKININSITYVIKLKIACQHVCAAETGHLHKLHIKIKNKP